MTQLKPLYRFSLSLIILCLFSWIVFQWLGLKIINDAYDGKSFGFLNNIINGQSEHAAFYYQFIATKYVKLITLITFSFVLLLLLFASTSKLAQAFKVIVITLFLLVFLLLSLEGFLSLKPFYRLPFLRYYDKLLPNNLLDRKPGEYHNFSLKTSTGKYIYDVTYTIDKYGRRITPVIDTPSRQQYLIFLGGSFTFGLGVEDKQTLPYWTGNAAQGYMPYNYGENGAGPFDILAQVETTDFNRAVKQKRGVFIYPIIYDHINRTIGRMSLLGWKKYAIFYKKNKAGQFVRSGTFQSEKPVLTKTYEFLADRQLTHYLKLDFPFSITEKHLEHVAQVINQIKNTLNEKYPDNPFVLLLYPSSTKLNRLIPYLEKYHIRYLDYTTLYDKNDKKYYLAEEDHHPTPLAYKIVAEQLVKDI